MGLLSLLLDGLFPQLCCHCKKIGSLICPACYEMLEFDSTISHLDSLISLQSATKYGHVSSSIVHTLKYQSVKEVAKLCAKIMFLSMSISSCDILTSVPLYPTRHSQRGFNQAELIALELGKYLNKPYLPLLIRSKETINFAKVKDKEEREHLSINLFNINARYTNKITDSSIMIIDDVWTTGSTLTSCAQTLLHHFPKNISAITFTHGM